MPILVDVNGDGPFDKDDDLVAGLPNITDETGDGKLDVNLTAALSSAVIGGAIFQDAANVGSGTGGYNTFLALDDQTGGEVPQDYYEQGFNSDDDNPLNGSNDELDVQKTHTVLLGSVPIKIINGVAYLEFRVDLNESNDTPDTNISLDQFKLYTSTSKTIESTADLFDTTAGDGDPALTSLAYDMDADRDISVLLSEANSSGSGNDDYSVLVPLANFAGLDPATTYLYLYVEMGRADGPGAVATSDWVANGGFEEWNLQNAVLIQGQKFNDLDGDGIKDAGEGGVEGVTIYIDDDLDGVAEATDNNGVLDTGEQFDITDANGNYSFGGIPIGSNDYTIYIREVVPAGSVPTTTLPVAVLIDNNYAAGTIIDYIDGPGTDPYVPGLLIGNLPLTPSVTITKDASGYGECADTAGETILYTIVVDNDGDLTLSNVVIQDNFEVGGNVTLVVTGLGGNGILDVGEVNRTGDTNSNGLMETTETWTYTYLRTVTQAQIDSDGGGDGSLTNVATVNASSANGAVTDNDGATVEVCQDPAIAIVKEAALEDGGDCIDEDGDVVNYTYTVTNAGNVALDNVTVDDDRLGAISGVDADIDGYNDGDTDEDGLLDVGESWAFAASYTATQDDIDANGDGNGFIHNIATANGEAAVSGEAALPAQDDADVEVCQLPSMTIAKNVRTDTTNGVFVAADSPTGPTASSQSTVNFQVLITNNGNMTLTAIALADYVHAYPSGTDTTIFYGTGSANPDDIEVNAQVDLDNDGTIDSSWDALDTNGDGTLSLAELPDGLAPGETMAIYYSLESKLGQHTNTVTVDTAETASQTNDANYYVFPNEDCVGVRTPGFWANTKWGLFWNFDPTKSATTTDQDALPQVGQPGFASGELLYAVDTNEDGFVNVKAGDTINDDKPLDPGSGLLIGDYNMNGITDAGEDTIFISLSDAKALINASSKQLSEGGKTADGTYMLGRDVVATWLNYLANNEETIGECVGVVDVTDGTNTPREFIDAAVDWLQQFASDANSTAANNLVNSYHDGNTQALFQFDGKQHPSSDPWQKAVTTGEDIPVSASEIHVQLDAYNNNGIIYGTEYCCDADSELAQAAQLQFA